MSDKTFPPSDRGPRILATIALTIAVAAFLAAIYLSVAYFLGPW